METTKNCSSQPLRRRMELGSVIILFTVVISTFLFTSTSCSRDNGEPDDNLVDLGNSMTFTTTNAVNSTVSLSIDAAQGDRTGVWIDLNNNGIKDHGESVTVFDADKEYTIASQTITVYGNITVFHCNRNKLIKLEVVKNPALTYLECGENNLTALDVTKNTALNYLSVSYNQLTTLDVTRNTALIRLYCYDNKLTALDVTRNTAMEILAFGNNQVTMIDLTKNTTLTSLDCCVNNLMALNITQNSALEDLWCNDNKLTALDVTKNSELAKLSCYRNKIYGQKMTDLVNNLPDRKAKTAGVFRVIDLTADENVCSQEQVTIAKERNWKVANSNGIPYGGSL